MASRRVQAISEDLKNVEFETSEGVEVIPTFDSMGLREDLLRGVYAYGKNYSKTPTKFAVQYTRVRESTHFYRNVCSTSYKF
jgi:hypothetical protein